MSFSTDLAQLVADQLARFVTLNRHQLAGQVANLDFWLAQIRHALSVLDGYGVRFLRLEAGQEQYVQKHGTVAFTPSAPYSSVEHRPPPPRRTPDREIQKARRALVTAARQFLERCQREGLLTEAQWADVIRDLGLE